MSIPVQITFRGLPPSEAVEARIREHADRLASFHRRISQCRIMVETPHRRHQHGKLYHVRIDVTFPGGEVVVGRDPRSNHAHEDIYVAIRDAFDAARRQLQDWVHRHRDGRPRDVSVVEDAG